MLRQRLAAATHSVGRGAVASRPQALFPLDTVRDFFGSHPLVQHLQLDTKELHTALLSLHALMTRSASDASRYPEVGPIGSDWAPAEVPGHLSDDALRWALQTTNESAASSDGTHNARSSALCASCHNGYLRLDAREGFRVCDACGAIQSQRAINVQPEYSETPDVSRGGGVRGVRGVSQWLVHKNAAPTHADMEHAPSVHWRDMEHWNYFTNLPLDELKAMDRVVREWKDGGHSGSVRMAAALLYPALRPHIPNEHDVRERLRLGKTLCAVRDVEPQPTFACAECLQRCHSAKTARYHCKSTMGSGRVSGGIRKQVRRSSH